MAVLAAVLMADLMTVVTAAFVWIIAKDHEMCS